MLDVLIEICPNVMVETHDTTFGLDPCEGTRVLGFGLIGVTSQLMMSFTIPTH